MGKPRAVVSFTLVAVLCGTMLRLAGAVAPDTSAQPASAASPRRDSSGPPPVPDSADPADSLDVLAESLGVPVDDGALRRQIVASARVLRSPVLNDRDVAAAASLLQKFLELDIRPTAPHLQQTRDAVRCLNETLAGKPPSCGRPADVHATGALVDRFLAAYLETDALHLEHPDNEARLLAIDFDRLDKSGLKRHVLQRAASDAGIDVSFLVATLPDPIDSFTGWQFDPMLDAITQAIANNDYVLDRFHFPDKDAEIAAGAGAGRAAGSAHEVEPGIIVFRSHSAQGRMSKDVGPNEQPAHRLVLFIVHENPASGVHVEAMARAIGEIVEWPSRAEEDTVRILGPTFSGSADSILRVLRQSRVELVSKGARLRFISGSATDPTVGKTLQQDPRLAVTFHATVHDDRALMRELLKEIRQVGWREPIAVLFEANTQYGRQVLEQMGSASEVPPRLIQLPFPLNISRIRATTPAAPGGASIFGLPSKLRPLPMETPKGSTADQIPQFNPPTTATYMELALASTLDTVRREHVKTVALMATDPRDKLFLAQQIARYTPDVSIVTAESDSLYIHPDYSSYLQGALVASTYPMFSANQQWSYGFEGSSTRRQFANGSAQGIYNAAVALLNYSEDGRPLYRAPVRPLLEYGMPGEPCGCDPHTGECPQVCQPPVWLSVVGRAGQWPVRAMRSSSSVMFPVVAPRASEHPRVNPSPTFQAFLILLTFGVFAFTVQASTRGRAGRGADGRGRESVAQTDAGRTRGYLLVAVAGVILIEAFITVLCGMRVSIESTASLGAVASLLISALGLLALLAFAGAVLAESITGDLPTLGAQAREGRLRTWGGVLFALVCVWTVGTLGAYLWDYSELAVPHMIGFVARALDFGSGVSPTLPVIFLGAALTIWAVTELTRVRSARVALAAAAVQPLVQETTLSDVRQWLPAWDLMNRSILAVPPGLWAVALLVLLATCLFAFDPVLEPLVTVEGPKFGRFVSAVMLLVQVMLTLAILQFVFLWSRLRQLLRSMTWHRMALAYESVPRDLFPGDLFPKVPRLIELQPAVAHWNRIVESGAVAGIPADCLDLDGQLGDDMRRDRGMPWSSSATWTKLLHAATSTATTLRTARGGQPMPVLPGAQAHETTLPTQALVTTTTEALAVARPPDQASAEAALVRVAAAAPAEAVVTAQETVIQVDVQRAVAVTARTDDSVKQSDHLIAMLMAFVIRDALARIGQNLLFVIGGGILVFCSHTLFPFQQHTGLQMLGWIYIACSFAAILTVLTQMKRDEIISRYTSTTPGVRTMWDREFVLKITVFALLPLLTLFAAQFPDLGGWLLQWIGPVQKALP